MGKTCKSASRKMYPWKPTNESTLKSLVLTAICEDVWPTIPSVGFQSIR